MSADTAHARFSNDEMLTITSVAAPWIDVGLWVGLERSSTPDHDRIVILLSHGHAYYLLQRDRHGGTYLLYCWPNDLRLIESGTLADCLRLFGPSASSTLQ